MRLKTLSIVTVLIILGFNCFGQNFDSIRISLEEIYSKNLLYRSQISKIMTQHGFESQQFDSLNQRILKFDSVALQTTKNIVDKHGWIGKDKIGTMANKAIFYSIQHASFDDQEKYFTLLEASAKNGQSDLSDMALMQDRILISKNKPQIYGTQYKMDEKTNVCIVFPVENPKKLDRKRKSVGLPSMKKAFGGREYRITTDF